MSSLQIRPSTAIVRWYQDGSYELRSPYKAVCSLNYLEDDHVFIYAMHGVLTKNDMRELFRTLASNGITKLTAERKGRLVTRDIVALLAVDDERHSKSDLSLLERVEEVRS